MAKGFEILSHTSELKIRAYGKTLEELFLHMLRGMSEAMQATYGEDPQSITREITIESQDRDTLLVDFLGEALYLSHVNREVYHDIHFTKFTADPSQHTRPAELQGELMGKKVEGLSEDIKAVTHHGVHIRKDPKGIWEVEVIYDI